MSNSLRSKVIRLAHQNPALRADLLPLLKTATEGAYPLDPRSAILYFDLVLEDFNVEEKAEEGDEIAKKMMEDSGVTINKMEFSAIKHLEHLFGVHISNEGHGSDDALVCKFGVNTWKDVDKAYDIIQRNLIGGDDEIEAGEPFFVARGFTLFPQGVNEARFGSMPGSKGDLSDWLEDHKPSR